MSQKLYVRRGGGASTATEVTSMTGRKGAPFFDEDQPVINMGRRAADGEASQGTFLLVDPEAEIHSTTYRLSPHALVTWTEDASGDELWLARSRIAPLESGRRGPYIADNDVEWDVTVNDNNIDLRGQPFTEAWVRPLETDNERVIALQAYTLNGSSSTAPHSRSSCNITADLDTNGHLIATATDRNMPAKTYPVGTQPQDVIAECAERAGKTYAVVIHHDGGESHDCLLYKGVLDHTTYATDVKVSDHSEEWDPDDVTTPVFEPIWDRGKGTLTENDDVWSGVVVIYGGTNDEPESVFVHDDADEEPYEYWVDVVQDDKSDTEAEATNLAEQLFTAHRAPGHRTHRFSILMKASQHHLITSGMSMEVKSAVIAGGADLNTYVWRYISELRWEPHPDGEHIWARIDLEKPLRRRGSRAQPAATTNPDSEPPFVEECDPTPGTELSNTEDDPTDWPGTVENTSPCWSGEDYLRMGASGGHSDLFSVSAGTTVQASVRVRNSTGSASWTLTSSYKYRVWIRLTGSGMPNIDTYIVDQLYPGDPVTDCIDVTKSGSVAVPTGYTGAALHFHGRNGGWKYQASMSTAAVDDCPPGSVPTGSAGTSDNVPRYDDPRLTSYNADDQHLITRLSQRVVNNSGGTLDVGDVVIPDTSYAGQGVTTTTTAALTAAMVGVVLEGADDDGDMVVVWQGVITTGVNDGASTSADGDYLYTSTTAGAASVSGSRTTGAVGRVVRDDAGDPDYVLWWGVPDTAGGGGGSGDVATDTIWDAKGDLAVGTGANTAARLAVGANDTIPMADSGETTGIKWVASGTPSTQAFGDAAAVGTADTFTRGDHKHAMPVTPSLDTLSNVVETSPANGDALAYDGTDWDNRPQYVNIPVVLGGAGTVLVTGEVLGLKVTVPFKCTILRWDLFADVSGSVVVDIWKDTYANFPPANGDSITASAKPTLSSVRNNQSSTLTGWTTTINADDVLAFEVESVTTVTQVTLNLICKRIY